MSGTEQVPTSEPVAVVSPTGNDNSRKSPGPEITPFVNHQSREDSENAQTAPTSDSEAIESVAAKIASKKRQQLREENEFGPEVKQIMADKRNWGGWHTTASDPNVFEYILREAGCKGIRVEEVYSIDEAEGGQYKPCYGLIFLMGFNAEYEKEVKEMGPGIPKELWFANQVAENACCTYGLLNIIMNIDESELGQELKSFKDFTQDLPPPIKGLAVSSFKLMKDAQNSFGARFEMEDADIALEEAAKANNQRRDDDDSDVAEEWDMSFHYIAYVHVSGSVWELDGLKNSPVKVCDCPPEEFEKMAIGKMESRIQQHPNGELHFNILALRRCRLRDARTERIRNARDLCAIDSLLTKLDPAWEESSREDILSGLYIVKAAKPSDMAKFDNMSGDQLKAERAKYIAMQKALDDTIATEQTELDSMNKALERKRFDYEPFVLKMAQMVEEEFATEAPKEAVKTKGKRVRR